MLPGGFVHRKEETKDVVVVRPLIYEMCEGAGNGYKRMPLMILDFNGFMRIVYATEAENIIC